MGGPRRVPTWHLPGTESLGPSPPEPCDQETAGSGRRWRRSRVAEKQPFVLRDCLNGWRVPRSAGAPDRQPEQPRALWPGRGVSPAPRTGPPRWMRTAPGRSAVPADDRCGWPGFVAGPCGSGLLPATRTSLFPFPAQRIRRHGLVSGQANFTDLLLGRREAGRRRNHRRREGLTRHRVGPGAVLTPAPAVSPGHRQATDGRVAAACAGAVVVVHPGRLPVAGCRLPGPGGAS